jgi:hypothetical protein
LQAEPFESPHAQARGLLMRSRQKKEPHFRVALFYLGVPKGIRTPVLTVKG